jgi:hypothetical protein
MHAAPTCCRSLLSVLEDAVLLLLLPMSSGAPAGNQAPSRQLKAMTSTAQNYCWVGLIYSDIRGQGVCFARPNASCAGELGQGPGLLVRAEVSSKHTEKCFHRMVVVERISCACSC